MLATPQDPHALLLLGEVHELEVRGERLHHAARVGEGQGLDALEEALPRGRVAGAMGLGQGPHRLHEVEEGRPFLLDDGLAEEVAEQVDLLAQTDRVRPWPAC